MRINVGVALVVVVLVVFSMFSIPRGFAGSLKKVYTIEEFQQRAGQITDVMSDREIINLYEEYFKDNLNFPDYTEEQIVAIARQTGEGVYLFDELDDFRKEAFVKKLGQVSYDSNEVAVGGSLGDLIDRIKKALEPRIICPGSLDNGPCNIPGETRCEENPDFSGGGGHACMQVCGLNGTWEEPTPCPSVMCSGNECA